MRANMTVNTLRNRLVLLIFAITAAAIGIVYLYVVPQLESSLTAEKLRQLDAQSNAAAPTLTRALEQHLPPDAVNTLVRQIAQRSDARLTVLAVNPQGEAKPSFVVADSQDEATATLPLFESAATAAGSGRPASSVETVSGQRLGESAVPVGASGRPQWVAVLSSPLGDVADNVSLIRRQILIAGAIALAAALAAGFWAARALSGRIARLKAAAEAVAEGDFNHQIPVGSADEIGQLALTFNEMQKRLARLDNSRKEFIANASHELRTPIFSLGGFVELLEHEDPDPEVRKEFVRTMREQIERLQKLTTDLLDLSRLDADAMEMHPVECDLTDLARGIATEFRPLARRHRSRLELRAGDERVLAHCDPDRTEQVLRILLDNALTHTPSGTKVTVTAARRGDHAELVVSDEGRGIERRALGRVFERFYSGDSSGGSGLGLAIADEITGRMDGELEAVSERGFTAFTLRLPAGREAAAELAGAAT
jgi:two-component system, OmpR family, sensor kinase